VIEIDATEAAIDRVGAFLSERIGLRSEGTLRGRLRRSIVDEAAVHGEDPGAYVERLRRGGEALEHLINRITVQESGFFRHPEHFDILANSILPGLDRPVTLWSAACGNGQEAYSLAMLLEERAIPGSVVASDLSTAALARTAKAWYTTHEISGISQERRRLHLVEHDRGSRMNPRVQARVTSFAHNLVDDLPSHVGSCQVVFCRNVLIYLSAEHARAFLDRLADALAPGAYLFLGAAESLWQVSDRFQPVRLGGAFVYRRREPAGRSHATSSGPTKPWTKPSTSSAVGSLPRPARPARRARRIVTPVDDGDLAQTASLAETGKVALAAGDHAAAIVIFRQWSYLTPDNPMGPFHLGLALEAGGHRMPAQRAFAVARAVLVGAGSEPVEQALEGFAREELVKLLDAKQAPYR
jgi:chemotaxis methyl-accepting protein methylase